MFVGRNQSYDTSIEKGAPKMTQKYYSFVTNLGLGQITNAVVLGGKVDLKYFAVGDGGGKSYTPDPSMTTLKNEVWRGNITGYRIDSESQNDIFITGIVPANVGGFTIREMAAFDSNGTMIAIATLADIVKPTVDEGESADAELTIHITVENSEVLNCTIDPNVIVATKADVKKMGDSIKNRFGQPNGIATLDGNGKLVQMPTADYALAADLAATNSELANKANQAELKSLIESKGKPSGIATLNSSGKLAQMPTAADVGAIALTSEGSWTPEVIEMLNSTGGCTYTSRAGHYIRIGKLTLVTFDVVNKTKPTGNDNWNNYVQVCIKGMPGPLARQNQAYSMGARVVLKAGDAPIAASTHLAYSTIAFTIPSGSLSTDKLGNGFELNGSIAYISS